MDDATWAEAMPELYDSRLGPVLFAPYAAELAARAAALRPARVLEVAAGTGIVTEALRAALPEVELLATDLNPPMVARGAQRVPTAGWAQADAQDLRYSSGSFDLVVCAFGAMFFPDRAAAYGQMRGVLDEDGTVLLSIWDDLPSNPFAAALDESLAAVLDDPPGFVARTPHGYADPQRIREDLTAAGFPDAQVERVVLPGRAPSARSLAEGYCLGTPLRFALGERGDLRELTEQVGAQMTARLGDGPVEAEQAAFLVTARLRPV